MAEQTISIEGVCRQFSLPAEAVQIIQNSLDTPGMFTSTFRLDGEEFKKTIQFKSVHMSNGGILTAPVDHFEDSFVRTVTNVAENRVKYETEGIESDIRVRRKP